MNIIFKTFYWVLILALVSIGALLMATMVPIPGNIEVKIVKSGSMEPTIPTGSVVLIRPEAAYAVGDIITFGEDNKRQIPTTHRIISVSNENGKEVFQTKGDANEVADPKPTQSNSVIGKVVFDVPRAGFILDFARTTLGFALLVGIPAGLIILDELLVIGREAKTYFARRRKHAMGESDIDERQSEREGKDMLRLAAEHVAESAQESVHDGVYFAAQRQHRIAQLRIARPRRFEDKRMRQEVLGPKMMDGIIVMKKSHAQS